MADQAPVLICITGPDGRCTWFNRTWLNFLGRTLAQQVDRGWVEWRPPERPLRLADQARRGGGCT